MLVLSRKTGEAIRIGADIEVSVLDVRGDTVRLGIEAPRSVQVWRKEIYDEIVLQNIRAAKASLPDDLLEAMKQKSSGGENNGR
ncbi:MAG: carbon storage regulator CsrA [Synergistaceae bacterium]|nr:carbon storage regulator CsrA [Synergistota bacterium]NLM72112.1 carbon storage regulator CsrA [Synergistaceae bacterium]